ncbi:MAG: hypothetical protein UZ18_ATM001002153, partial [Armatimonadetes bacterium OLB18]
MPPRGLAEKPFFEKAGSLLPGRDLVGRAAKIERCEPRIDVAVGHSGR